MRRMIDPEEYEGVHHRCDWDCGAEVYFNVHEQAWQMADNTVLTEEHDATEEDMVDARIRAKAEGFAGEDMQLHTYIAA